jgi:hypothetical protein
MALVNRGDDLLYAHRTELLPALFRQRFHVGDRLLDLLPAAIRFRHKAGDAAPVPGDRDGLAALDGVEQLGEMRNLIEAVTTAAAKGAITPVQTDALIRIVNTALAMI